MAPLTLDVDGRDLIFSEPPKARAAARRWSRMARDLDASDAPPDAKTKVRELRARAKAANDWARVEEDRAPAEPREEPPAPSSEEADQPAGGNPSPSRRRAAAALAENGARHSKQARAKTGRAVRRYERAGGADVTSWGELAIFFFGSVIAMVLLDDALSAKGSTAIGKSVTTATAIAHRIIEPVPIVKAN
jgi:hypothetical protein